MATGSPPDEVLAGIASSGKTPQLMLHCCCAPCASHVLEYLSPFFRITILFYNPNIQPQEEYFKRAAEIQKLLASAAYPNQIDSHVCVYDTAVFEEAVRPYSGEPEGGKRCRICYELRLGEVAGRAKADGFDYFTTTLSVSPHKDAALLKDIGADLSVAFGVNHLHSDFKKRNGYKRTVFLSKQYGLYRQSYCGCKL